MISIPETSFIVTNFFSKSNANPNGGGHVVKWAFTRSYSRNCQSDQRASCDLVFHCRVTWKI